MGKGQGGEMWCMAKHPWVGSGWAGVCVVWRWESYGVRNGERRLWLTAPPPPFPSLCARIGWWVGECEKKNLQNSMKRVEGQTR